MKRISIPLIMLLALIFVIVCFVFFKNNKYINDEPIAVIHSRWSSSFISDVGELTEYRIFKQSSKKYTYVKMVARVTVDGPGEYQVEEEGNINSEEELDTLVYNIIENNNYTSFTYRDKSVHGFEEQEKNYQVFKNLLFKH